MHILFCCFSAPLLRLIKVFRLQLSNQNATPFCFCPEVNSAMLFRDMQPIKLQKKHYSDLEYMLIPVIYSTFPILLFEMRFLLLFPRFQLLQFWNVTYFRHRRLCMNVVLSPNLVNGVDGLETR